MEETLKYNFKRKKEKYASNNMKGQRFLMKPSCINPKINCYINCQYLNGVNLSVHLTQLLMFSTRCARESTTLTYNILSIL